MNEGALDLFRLSLEVAGAGDAGIAALRVAEQVKEIFGVSPELEILPRGTIAREFEASIKPPRFADRRQQDGGGARLR